MSDPPYIILIIGGSRLGKTSSLCNLINEEPDIDKIYLYTKDPYKSKYRFLLEKKWKYRIKAF